jgi:hypothetical protein
MLKTLQNIPIPLLLLLATTLEVSGDAVVRLGIYQHAGLIRAVWFVGGAALLLGYGFFLNTAPVEFGRIVGLYVATLFVVWQFIDLLVFRTPPGLPVWVGGTLVVAGAVLSLPSGVALDVPHAGDLSCGKAQYCGSCSRSAWQSRRPVSRVLCRGLMANSCERLAGSCAVAAHTQALH